jgi:hypothetical protein
MDIHDIPFGDDGGKPKNERALHNQRAVVMNSGSCIAQYRSYISAREQQAANRTARQNSRQMIKEFKEKREAYNDWFDALHSNEKSRERLQWKAAGNKQRYIEIFDVSVLPARNINALADMQSDHEDSCDENREDNEDEHELIIVIPRRHLTPTADL